MNNFYLYKAKEKNTGKWITGFYAYKKETTYCFKQDYEKYPVKKIHYIIQDCMTDWGLPNTLRQIEVDGNTLCRGTGLKNKNGELLWEHDVVACEDDDSVVSVIKWDNENARFVLEDYGYDEDDGKFMKFDYNSFDNFISFDDWAITIGNEIDASLQELQNVLGGTTV